MNAADVVEVVQKRTESRLAAWWSAYRWVAILVLLLLASLWVNALQWRAKAVRKAEARAEVAQEFAAVTAGLARQAQRDNGALLIDLATLVDRGRTERVVYRQAAAQRPLAGNCAPGQARMDAVNAGADR